MRVRRPTRLTVERCEDRVTPTVDLSGLSFTDGPGLTAPRPAPPPVPAALSPASVSDGTTRFRLDPTFGTGGRTYLTPNLVPGSMHGSALEFVVGADGKIVVLGQLNGGAVVARFTADGRLDPTFGGDGVVSLGPWDETVSSFGLTKLAVLPDGRILLAGSVGSGTYPGPLPLPLSDALHPYPVPDSDLVVVRLTAAGELDPTFDGDGRAVVGFDAADGPSNEYLIGFGVTADGGIVLGGSVSTFYPYPPVPPTVPSSPPPSTGGPPYYYPQTQSVFGLARLTADGKLDPSFGDDGTARIESSDDRPGTFSAMTVLADGRVVLAGSHSPSWAGTPPAPNTLLTAARVTADGDLDPTFGGDGFTAIPITAAAESYTASVYPLTVGVQPGGSVVVGASGYGLVTTGGTTVVAYRFTPAGAADPSFGTDGRVTVVLPDYSYGAGMSVAADGRLYVVAPTQHPVTIADQGLSIYPPPYPQLTTTTVYRFTPGGLPDTTLGPDGRVTIPDGPAGQSILGTRALTDSAGRLLVAGSTDHSPVTGTRIALARLALTDAPPPVPILVNGPGGKATEYAPGPDGRFVAGDSVEAFPGFTGAVRVVRADINGDGTPDTIAAIGPGGGSRVMVMLNVPDDLAPVILVRGPFEFPVFEESFTGGVFVAAGDIDGDGKADLVVTPDEGGGPVAVVYRGADLASGKAIPVTRFFGIEDANFRGGARPALGDLNGDGKADLTVAAGYLGGPRVAVFDGADLAAGTAAPRRLVNDFFAFEDSLRNGVFVAAGDVTGDGRADLVFGGGPSGGPRVRLFDGQMLLAAGQFSKLDEVPAAERANFFAGDAALRGGVRLALRDVDGDGQADLSTGSGEGEPSRVRVYMAPTLLAAPAPTADQELDPFGAVLAEGVYVG